MDKSKIPVRYGNLKAAVSKTLGLLSGKSDIGHEHSVSDITDFPNSLPANGGNAGTATKLQTPRTIAITGDSVGSGTFDGSANLTLDTIRRGCIVGNNGSKTKPYYKFASITLNSGYDDVRIIFKVSSTLTNYPESKGILSVYIGTDSSAAIESTSISWETVNSDIDPNKFMLLYAPDSRPTAELWVKIERNAYERYGFEVLSEGRVHTREVCWTLYDNQGNGAVGVTEGYEVRYSTLATIKNPTEDTQDEEKTVKLTNTAKYPFNNSITSVSMEKARNTKNYTVEAEVIASDGNVGEIVVSDKTLNGFKIEFTGSAKNVTVTIKIRGGILA